MFQTVINGRPVCLALSGFLDAEFTEFTLLHRLFLKHLRITKGLNIPRATHNANTYGVTGQGLAGMGLPWAGW